MDYYHIRYYLCSRWCPWSCECKDFKEFGTREIALGVYTIIINFVLVLLARKSKAANTSKFWDVLFLILGFLAGNIFYFLGGLFGIIARR